MGISFERTAYAGNMPPFWRGEFKVLPGDFKLKQTFAVGTVIPAGTPIQIDFANMECAVVKVAKVLAGGTTTIPRVTKGTLLKVGDNVMKLGKTDVSRAVSAIDTTNDAYDVITLDGAIAGLTAGDFLQESSEVVEATAEVKGVYKLTIGTNATAADKLTIDGVDYTFAAAAAEGVFAVGATALASAANLEDAVSAQYDGIFSVKADGAKLVFTQLVGGVGAIPVISVTQTGGGTLAASIAQTTAGVAAVAALTAPLYELPDAVVETTKVYATANDFQTVSAGYEGVVLKEVVYPVPASWLEGFSLKNNHSIKYIKQ